ncbi:MAG: arginase [Fimbriimonadales bacterium]|nr:arginase [Fimbriimonadales bacterium]
MVRVVGAPFDLCGRAAGSRMGPAGMRLAGLLRALRSLGVEAEDLGDVPVPLPPSDTEPGFRGFRAFLEVAAALRERVAAVLAAGATPLVLGGDHSLSAGSVAGALDHFGESLAVLWIDAHADLNTPDTSPTGNLHGMPLGLLADLGDGGSSRRAEEWELARARLLPATPLAPRRIGWLGLREVDPPEAARIRRFEGSFVATMHDIDRHGVVAALDGVRRWMAETRPDALWVSFDVDVLDPVLAPGTGTAVRGGLTYREAHLVAELLHEALFREDCPARLAGLDVMETNPMLDAGNTTAVTAVEWVASLFGKTILGER